MVIDSMTYKAEFEDAETGTKLSLSFRITKKSLVEAGILILVVLVLTKSDCLEPAGCLRNSFFLSGLNLEPLAGDGVKRGSRGGGVYRKEPFFS
mmetsp:Transcript_27925/g.36617  ORF Transcript_27925/g.36617 Transcript_27925/m.36617 type:complete len:94 (+) Transcript_27925:490-771(+)